MIPPDQRPRNLRNRENRVVRHLPLVRSIANGLCANAPRVEIDDLVSAGTVGLIEAVERYDQKRGVPFASYAYIRIRGAIIDEIRRVVAPSDPGDVASEPLSLEAPILAESSLTLMDVTIDPLASEPQQAAELSDLFEAIRHLPLREREMLGRSAAGHTVAEIAGFYGCSESRASQLLVQARFRLEERTAA
jgi:RNA polymerase sigma factor (sigma-70 family)